MGPTCTIPGSYLVPPFGPAKDGNNNRPAGERFAFPCTTPRASYPQPLVRQTFTKIRGRKLHGALPPVRPATLTLSSVLSEAYQAQVVRHFESRIGLTGTSVAIDNTILYYGFGETRPGSYVVTGEDGFLFLSEDIAHFNKRPSELPSASDIESSADRIALVQQRLAKQHRAFVPVLIPAKTTVWRDKIAPAWRSSNQPPISDEFSYRAMKRALEHRGVVFVDVHVLLSSSPPPRSMLWGKQARHWSMYGACLAMSAVTQAYSKLTGKARPAYPCDLVMTEANPQLSADFDLWRLLNTMFVPPSPTRVPEVRLAPEHANHSRGTQTQSMRESWSGAAQATRLDQQPARPGVQRPSGSCPVLPCGPGHTRRGSVGGEPIAAPCLTRNVHDTPVARGGFWA